MLAAEISEQTLPTCSDVEQRYADVVSAGLACTCDDDCRVLVGQCSVGLGGCYEAGGTCAEQGLLDQLAGLYRSHSEGCTGAACDCGEAPPVRCVASRCVLDAR